MICYIQGSLACHTRFVRNKYSEKSDISITASSWSGTVALKKAGINWEWKGEEKETGTHTHGETGAFHTFPFCRGQEMMCVRLQHPSAALMLLGRVTAGAEGWLLSHHHRNHSGKWLLHPQCSQLGCSQAPMAEQCPDVTQNRPPSLVSRVKLCPDSQGQAAPRALEEDGPLIPELPHQTPPTASQSFLPSLHTCQMTL